MTWDLLLGLSYFLGLTVLMLGSAWLPWPWYLPGGVAVLLGFGWCLNWALQGADGPSGLGVLALHSGILMLGALTHLLRWLLTGWRWWRRRQALR